MRSLAFLLTRRWLVFAVVVGLLAWLAWVLGEWQFHRLDERREQNAHVVANEGTDPAPVEHVLAVDEGLPESEEWRLVTATGTYATDQTVIVRYQTREGEAGVDVVVPLVTADGTAVVVDRGWLLSDNSAAVPDDVPDPPAGTVTITGWVRADATGGAAEVTDRSTRAVSGERIGAALGITTYRGFVDLRSEDPAPRTPLVAAELPDLGEGPHFFYGLQWWFFGLLAIGGFCWLARDEWLAGRGRSHSRVTGRAAAHRRPGASLR